MYKGPLTCITTRALLRQTNRRTIATAMWTTIEQSSMRLTYFCKVRTLPLLVCGILLL